MFCNEPIRKVYHIVYCSEREQPWHNAFFQSTYQLEFHTTEGYWLGFETDHHFITIGYDGVKISEDSSAFHNEPYDILDLDEIGTSFETAVFSGERIVAVEPKKDHIRIHLDHIVLLLYVYGEKDWKWFEHHTRVRDYLPLAGCERLLQVRCHCGGEGQVLLDHVDDYVVRCQNCHASTYAHMRITDAVEEWNRGETPCVATTGMESLTACLQRKPLRYIAIADDYHWFLDDNLCDTDCLVLAFETSCFFLSCTRTHDEGTAFTATAVCDYNRELYPYEIHPSENGCLRFVEFESIDDFAGMLLMLDDAELFISTDVDGTLTIGTGCDDTTLTTPKRRGLVLGMTFD